MIVALLAGTAGLYTTLGGLRAVIYTEAVQAIVLMAAPPSGHQQKGLASSLRQSEIGSYYAATVLKSLSSIMQALLSLLALQSIVGAIHGQSYHPQFRR